MSVFKLLLQNLWFHRRSNIAILLGVTVGTAVLTGALLVGDSLRGSLRQLTLQRLGWVDQVLVSPHFFRERVADELVLKKVGSHVAPVIFLQASAEKESLTARKVSLIGMDHRYWKSHIPSVDPKFSKKQEIVFLNEAMAESLKVQVGDEVTFHIRKRSEVPEESVLGKKKAADALSELTLTVAAILSRDQPMADFKMASDPQPARNAFVPLPLLQQKLDPDETPDKESRVNALLVEGGTDRLAKTLTDTLTLRDWGLVLRTPTSRVEGLLNGISPARREEGLRRSDWRGRIPESIIPQIDMDKNSRLTEKELINFYRRERGYLSLESRRLMLQPSTVDAAMNAAKETNLRASPTLVYLANSIQKVGESDKEIPYSVVAAVEPDQQSPLGPFRAKNGEPIKDNEILLIQWDDMPLDVIVGDSIRMVYFEPEHTGEPEEKTAEFRLAGFVPLKGLTADETLTPEFPGITDKLSIGQWNPPFPYDSRRIKARDDRYWREYRTTPKAYITLHRGKELWQSRFGEVTSIRLAAEENRDLNEAASAYRKLLLSMLKPEQGGFVFLHLREDNLKASQGGGFDFGMLFVGFSFFLIIAALLLVGLLFRLSLDRRAMEIGLLDALGFTRATTRKILLAEGGLLALIGGVFGLLVAYFYAGWLLTLLKSKWAGESSLFFLERHVTIMSMLIGYFGTLLMSIGTIWWALRALSKVTPRGLLHGQTTETELTRTGPPRKRMIAAIICLVLGVILLIAGNFVKQHEAQAGTFFGSGSMLLIAGLCFLSAWFSSSPAKSSVSAGGGSLAVAHLGARNAGRHSTRSMLTAGLLASAAFLLVAVECFRRQPGGDYDKKDSGSGGYTLLAESDLPIVTDLNSDAGHQELLNNLELIYNQDPDARESDPNNPEQTILEAKLANDKQLLEQTKIQSFRVRAGDDASCLNLYQPRRPQILGVPDAIIERGGFQFSGQIEDREKPWTLLTNDPGETIPVFGEQNTVIWMLKASTGDVLDIEDSQGEVQKVKIAALLKDSVFQSSLLMSENDFKRLYPQQIGYRFFLIQPPAGQQDAVAKLLRTALNQEGLEVIPTAKRLAQYLAVENMYLSTFQALGGMGMLLGSLGLAIVLLRSVWERRAELALLRALGYRRSTLGWLVFSENGFLLLLGLGLGTIAALVSVAPHVLSSGGTVDWLNLSKTLAIVLAVGVITLTIAVASTVRASLVPALRRE